MRNSLFRAWPPIVQVMVNPLSHTENKEEEKGKLFNKCDEKHIRGYIHRRRLPHEKHH